MFDNDPKFNLYKMASKNEEEESEGSRSPASSPDYFKQLLDQWGSITNTPAQEDIPLPNPNAYEAPISQTNGFNDLLNDWDKYLGKKPQEQIQIPFAPESELQERQPNLPSVDLQPKEMVVPKPKQPAQPEAPSQPMVAPEPQQSEYDKLLEQYAKYQSDAKSQLDEARRKDADMQLYTQLANAGSMIGTGLANRGGNTNFKPIELQKVGDPIGAAKEKLAIDASKFDKLKEFRTLAREQELHDPNSQQSKSVRAMMESQFPDLKANYGKAWDSMPAASFDDIFKVLQLKETQQARVAAAEAMAGQRRELAESKAEERAKEKAKLSEKQVSGINDFDDSVNRMKEALSSLGERSEWVGPVDGRLPDWAVSDDQVAFRSAVGRMSDAYRKLITGAGAGYQEIARLESRLPQVNDTLENFKAKAKSFIKEVEKTKSTHLKNMEKAGKNVEEFKSPEISESKMIKVKDPSGKIRNIPEDKLDEALKAGGTFLGQE